MQAQLFLTTLNADFYSGVPDSLLKPLCDCLMDTYGIDGAHHIIAANEGNCTAIAAGYHLATGKVPVVYLQNSGEGNIINPVASLLHERVYGIPCIFVIGWRGEPGTMDEPQHIYQGIVTEKLLEDMEIESMIFGKETTQEDLRRQMAAWHPLLEAGKSVAIIVQKGALDYQSVSYKNENKMQRETIIRLVTDVTEEDMIVSTTGKTSRELFEIREQKGQSHAYDFLTVGSMGHSSSIAMGLALGNPSLKVWCLDGDGAMLMHMGAMAVIGTQKVPNLVHILINNSAHETVGGMPTVAKGLDLPAIASACGYEKVYSVSDDESLKRVLKEAKQAPCLTFIEAKAAIGSRADLGRPTTTPMQNKQSFMKRCRAAL